MIDDLKEQEGVDGVRGFRTGRYQPNSCAAFYFREFVANLFLEPGHRCDTWWIRVVNEHRCVEIPGGKHLGDMSKVGADLLDTGFVVRVFALTAISPPSLNSRK